MEPGQLEFSFAPALRAPEQLAYWAGFFDGEGCVRCNHAQSNVGRNRSGNGIQFGVSVCQCSPIVVRELHDEYGGGLRTEKGRKSQHRTKWVWQACGTNAERFLRDILPYLREKKEEAELALEVYKTMGWQKMRKGRPKTACMPPEMVAFRDNLVERIRLLKHRDCA